LAGNIGRPVLELLPKLKEASWVVLELSSFQLIDLTKSPHIAVVLNITEDHLDWHKNIEEYLDAKKNIVTHQTHDDFSVVNYDYKTSREFGTLAKGSVFCFSRLGDVKGSFVSKNRIVLNMDRNEIIGSTDSLLLRGQHNWENITAAICAAKLAGANISAIKKVVFSFRGLEHRLELVGEADGIKYYNDSFGTGPETVLAAADSFHEPTTLIIGGFNKGLKYDQMVDKLSRKENLQCVVLIGDIGKNLKKLFEEGEFKGKIIYTGKSGMKTIVKKASYATPKDGVVLLAPGTSSFDMFENYKDRGNQFKSAVKQIKAN
jgi:UDP-N-acetylmuramoylalanine--D-glutamate ligase